MSTAAFFNPGVIPGSQTTGSSNYVVGADISVTVAGVALVGLYYFKNAGDTVASRAGAVYRTSDQSLLGSLTFAGETASGWQYQAFSSPVSLPSGFTYRACILVGGTYYYYNSFPGSTKFPEASMSVTGSYAPGTAMAYPTNTNSNVNQAIDVNLSGVTIVPTTLRASQDLAETWMTDTAPLRASQSLAEVWIQNQPPTDLRASQDLGEVWITNTGPLTALRASQLVAEVWQTTTLAPVVPPYRRYQVSAGVS